MSKVLKVVATVAAIALAIPTGGTSLLAVGLGVSSLAATAIVVGLSVGATLLARRPKVPAGSPENQNRLRATIDPNTPRKTVFGRTAMATDIRDEEFTGTDQEYFHRFIVVAAHKVQAISEIWFDEQLAWTVGGGVTSNYIGYLEVAPILEGSAGNAINISARMGSTRRYTGLAYVHIRYKLTGNTKKVASPFASSVTTRITIKGDGALIYDPRMDSTVAGGVGPQRADDQSTWVWNDDACRNPSLGLLAYLLGWRIGGELSVGLGVPKSRINLESFAVAANICDEPILAIGGGTEPRYRANGVWSESDDPSTVFDMFKSSMNADLDDVDGLFRLTIFRDDLAVSDADFTADDILDDFDWSPSEAIDQTFNVIRGTYTDASAASLYQQVDYPQIKVASPDGIDRIETVNFPMVESAGQAQRLAATRLYRQQFGGVFKAAFQATAWRVQKNSIVRLTFPPCGFVNKVFRVAEMELRVDGTVPLTLREESNAIYVAPALVVPVSAIAATPYDPFNSPIIDTLLNIDLIRNASIKNPRDGADVPRALLTATTTGGGVATISVARHDWDYPSTAVDVTRALGSVAALAAATEYYVYFDDATLANGAPTYFATIDPSQGQNSTDHPSRHALGKIVTPVASGAPSEGGAVPGYGYLSVAEGIPGADGLSGLITGLTFPRKTLPVSGTGLVTSYANATTTMTIVDILGADVSANFTLSTAANPHALTVGYTGMAIAVTAGADPGEAPWNITVLATGSGPYAGYLLRQTFFMDAGEATLALIYSAPTANIEVPDAPVVTVAPAVTRTFVTGNASVSATFTFAYSAVPTHKNNITAIAVGYRVQDTNAAYTWGSDPASEIWEDREADFTSGTFPWTLLADKPAEKYYRFAFRAVRTGVLSSLVASQRVESAITAIATAFRPADHGAYAPQKRRLSLAASPLPTPTFAVDGSAVIVTLGGNGMADITTIWSYAGSAALYDGFEVAWYAQDGAGTYTIGTTPDQEWRNDNPPEKKASRNPSVLPNKRYTFGVRAYRLVDDDIAGVVGGRIYSAWGQPTLAANNPIYPDNIITMNGSVVAIDAVFAVNVKTWSQYANSGLNSDGTVRTGKVITDSFSVQAAIAAGYAVQTATAGLATNETWLSSIGSAIRLDGVNVNLDLKFSFAIGMLDPVIGTAYNIAVRAFIRRVSSGTYYYSSDVWTREFIWQRATTTGSFNGPKQEFNGEFLFNPPVGGADYTYGFEVDCGTTNWATLYPRAVRIKDMRGGVE